MEQAGGYLSTYEEWLQSTKTTTGADIVERVALEKSLNPRLLLALLDYQSNWVFGQPANQAQVDYPMGNIDLAEKGLYHQLVWAVNHLSVGFYSWREGRLTDLSFSDGTTIRLAPDQNAGSVALESYFSQLYDVEYWLQVVHPQSGFPAFYESKFGSPWLRDRYISLRATYDENTTFGLIGCNLRRMATRPGAFIRTSGAAVDHTTEAKIMTSAKVCSRCREKLTLEGEKYGKHRREVSRQLKMIFRRYNGT